MHRTQTGKGVTSDENQANAAKFAQIDLVDLLQNKVRDQTKRDTIGLLYFAKRNEKRNETKRNEK